MIVKRKLHGNMDEVMYPNDFEEEKDDNDVGDNDAKDNFVHGHKTKRDYA